MLSRLLCAMVLGVLAVQCESQDCDGMGCVDYFATELGFERAAADRDTDRALSKRVRDASNTDAGRSPWEQNFDATRMRRDARKVLLSSEACA